MKALFISISLFAFIACGDCYSMKYFKSSVTNEDTADHAVTICRKDDHTQLKDLTISAGKLAKVEWDSSKIFNRTDLSSTCHDRHDEEVAVPFLLTAATQTTVKLCLSSDGTYSITLASIACASGSVEVTDNCTSP